MTNSEPYLIVTPPTDKIACSWYPVLHQQRKLIIQHLTVGPTNFNILFANSIEREDKKWIEKAIDILCQRHEILRTTYAYVDGEVLQQVHPGPSPALELKYNTLVNCADKNKALMDIIAEMDAIKSDCVNGPITHVRWIDYDEITARVICCISHISTDRHSVSIIRKEIEIIIKELKEDRVASLPPPQYQLRDYVEWVDRYAASEQGAAARQRYKKAVFDSVAGETNMEIPWENSYEATVTKELNRILDNQRPHWYEKIFGNVIQFTPYPTARYFFYIDELFLLKLNQLVLAYSCSLLIILFAAFSLLFYQVRNSEFIRICTPSSLKRISDKWSSVIGWMTAEVIICQQLDPGCRIDHFLQDVTESLASADEYQCYPFENLLKDLNFPIHITAPVFLNMMRDKNDIINDFQARHSDGGSAIFEFDCAVVECRNGIRFRTTYNTDAYTPQAIEGMFKKYFGLLHRLADSHKNDTLSDILR